MIDAKLLQAKSDQMNSIDFIHPMLMRIEKVDLNDRDPQPIKMHMEGYKGRPWKPSKGMLRGLVQAWGKDEQKWVGRLVELHCNPSVKWGGEDAGGIQVCGLSHIDKPEEVTVRINRSQREVHTWRVLDDEQAVEVEFVLTQWQVDIRDAESNEAINTIVQTVKKQFGVEKLRELKDDVIAARKAFDIPKDETTEGDA